MEGQINAENSKVRALRYAARRRWRAEQLRAFITAAREAAITNGEAVNAGSPFGDWIIWAERQADRMDPLKENPPSILDRIPGLEQAYPSYYGYGYRKPDPPFRFPKRLADEVRSRACLRLGSPPISTWGIRTSSGTCNRPFGTVADMDPQIIDRLNASVNEHDLLYFLGDFCRGTGKEALAYRRRMWCKNIFSIEGNHGAGAKKICAEFGWWKQLAEVRVRDQLIVLCHYAMRVWHHSFQSS